MATRTRRLDLVKPTLDDGVDPVSQIADNMQRIDDGVALVGHGHTGGEDGQPIQASGLADGAVTDAKIGNRTINQSLASPANTGSLTSLLSWLAGRIKVITGAANWYDAPATTLAAAKAHMDNKNNPHGVTPAQIGAETPAGAQAKADAVQANLNSHINTTSSVHGATSSAMPNRLIIRDSAGRAKIAAPAEADDIARKDTVDNLKSSANTWSQRQTFSAGIQDGDGNTDVSLVYSVQHHVHTRSTVLTYGDDGSLLKVEEKSGSTVVKSTVLNYVDGQLATIAVTAGGVTKTVMLVYDPDSGRLVGINRA